MIYGIGIDIVKNERIKKIINKYDEKFIKKYFNDEEYMKTKNLVEKLAKLYSAKEAFFKSLGTGLRFNMSFKDISILNDSLGKPYIKITSTTKEYIENNIDIIEKLNIQLSISDEKEFSISYVIIEKKDKS